MVATEVAPAADVDPTQRAVLRAVFRESKRAGSPQAILVTGAAGTGKSKVLKAMMAVAESKGIPLMVTAFTGRAAVLLGPSATTIHSAMGWRVPPKGATDAKNNPHSPAAFAAQSFANPKVKERIRRRNLILVIEEGSMVDVRSFFAMDLAFRRCLGNDAPFGGVRVVVFADFCQLKPIVTDDMKEFCEGCTFVFETALWRTRMRPQVFHLTKVYRQLDQSPFAQCLGRLRLGRHTAEDRALLESRIGAPVEGCPQGIVPTQLFCRRAPVDEVNARGLAAIASPAFEVHRVYRGIGSDAAAQRRARAMVSKDAQVPDALCLKVGAQVMLRSNMDTRLGLCNGSLGVVVSIEHSGEEPVVVPTMASLRDEGAEPEPPQVLPASGPCTQFKVVVAFDNGVQCAVPPVSVTHGVDGREVLQELQIPLCLAWAMTVYLAQGSSIPFVDILFDTWDESQAYTMVSRATSLGGLTIKRAFDMGIFGVHPAAAEFYAALDGAEAPVCGKHAADDEGEDDSE